MRRPKEIIVLLALLAAAMAFVLWYVIDRRAKNRAASPRPAATQPAPGPTPAVPGPQPAPAPVTTTTAGTAAEPVDLTRHERQTIDYSSGKPVVKNSAEDQAAIDAAMKDIAEATKGVTFDPPPKKKPAPPAPAK